MSNKFGSKSTEPVGFIHRDKAVWVRLHVNTMTPYQLHTHSLKHTYPQTHTHPRSINSHARTHAHTDPTSINSHAHTHTRTQISQISQHTHTRSYDIQLFWFCFNVNPENLFQGKQKETIQVYFLFHQWSKAFSFFLFPFITVNNECKQWIIYHFLSSKWFRIPRIKIALLGEKNKIK